MDNIFNRKFPQKLGKNKLIIILRAKQNNLLEFVNPHVQQKMKPMTNLKQKTLDLICNTILGNGGIREVGICQCISQTIQKPQ